MTNNFNFFYLFFTFLVPLNIFNSNLLIKENKLNLNIASFNLLITSVIFYFYYHIIPILLHLIEFVI